MYEILISCCVRESLSRQCHYDSSHASKDRQGFVRSTRTPKTEIETFIIYAKKKKYIFLSLNTQVTTAAHL